MTAGWVAATTRGRALLDRLVGAEGARALAECSTWPEARAQLCRSFYGTELAADADRGAARTGAAAATVWQLRVLAGWLPPGTVGLARLFAGPMEIANIEERLRGRGGATPAAAIRLGSLALAWPRVAVASSPEQIRHALARSAWGDPGGSDPLAIGVGLRVAWARRIVRRAPGAAEWARGATAVLLAREIFAFDRTPTDRTSREIDALLGTRWRRATDVVDLRDRLPESAAWALAPVGSTDELWRAEVAVANRAGDDADRLAMSGRYDRDTVVAIMTMLLVDLWRVTAAIEAAGRASREAFDDVA